MKMASLLVAVLAAFALCLSVSAEEKSTATKPEKTPKKTEKKSDPVVEKTALTGSYVKRDVKRSGVVTDGHSQVLVLDNDSIRSSGAGDLNQLLVRRGIRR